MSDKKKLDLPYICIIPASVQADESLPDAVKIYFGQLVALAEKFGYCWATDEMLAEMKNTSIRNIERYNQLLEQGLYIVRDTRNYPEKNTEGKFIWIKKRKIYVGNAFSRKVTESDNIDGTEFLEPAKNGGSLEPAKNGGYNNKHLNIEERKKEDSFIPSPNFEDKIRELLMPYDPDEAIIKLALEETPEIVKDALKAADDYCVKKKIDDKLPVINKAIYGKWKPNASEADLEKAAEEKKNRSHMLAFERKKECEVLFSTYEKYIKFKGILEFIIKNDRLEMRQAENGWLIVSFEESNCVEILKQYIQERMEILK